VRIQIMNKTVAYLFLFLLLLLSKNICHAADPQITLNNASALYGLNDLTKLDCYTTDSLTINGIKVAKPVNPDWSRAIDVAHTIRVLLFYDADNGTLDAWVIRRSKVSGWDLVKADRIQYTDEGHKYGLPKLGVPLLSANNITLNDSTHRSFYCLDYSHNVLRRFSLQFNPLFRYKLSIFHLSETIVENFQSTGDHASQAVFFAGDSTRGQCLAIYQQKHKSWKVVPIFRDIYSEQIETLVNAWSGAIIDAMKIALYNITADSTLDSSFINTRLNIMINDIFKSNLYFQESGHSEQIDGYNIGAVTPLADSTVSHKFILLDSYIGCLFKFHSGYGYPMVPDDRKNPRGPCYEAAYPLFDDWNVEFTETLLTDEIRVMRSPLRGFQPVEVDRTGRLWFAPRTPAKIFVLPDADFPDRARYNPPAATHQLVTIPTTYTSKRASVLHIDGSIAGQITLVMSEGIETFNIQEQ